ncbi:MAG TPA: hypothetical protein VN282_04410 [Pyrinomonadaceae bacterium]|nr:hypothetical protein [Pyrinomonadaceae bacterium]
MKHRSVIAFVIVAAALFALPQLSHDLQALKGAAGARLHRELLHAFLSLPAGEPTSAVIVQSPSDNLLASCTKEKSDAAAAKSGKVGAYGRAEGRASGKTSEESAMIGDPAHDPVNKHVASAGVKEAADVVVASLPEIEVETAEVAMLVPPDSRMDPRAPADTLVVTDAARAEADKLRAEAVSLRAAYVTAARVQANGPEWQKATEEAFRRLNGSLPGTYEFRLVRDGAKGKVLKLKCNECPATAPRLTRLPRQAALTMPLPAPVAPAESLGE